MGVRSSGVGVVLVSAMLLGTGVGVAYAAPPDTGVPWKGHCEGAKAKKPDEKALIVQACQRAYSAAARAKAASESIVGTDENGPSNDKSSADSNAAAAADAAIDTDGAADDAEAADDASSAADYASSATRNVQSGSSASSAARPTRR